MDSQQEKFIVGVLLILGVIGLILSVQDYESRTPNPGDRFKNPDSSDLRTQYVAESTEVWSGPGSEFFVQDELPPGEEVVVNQKAKTGEWIGLQSEFSGVEGYVQHENLTTRDTLRREPRAVEASWSFGTGIAKEETIDQPSKAQVKQRVYVSGNVTEDGLRNFLQDRYADLLARTGFDHYDHATNVAVYVHETQEEAKSGGVGWLAALTKEKSDSQPDIQVDQRAVEAHNQRPTEQWGLAESTRKEMWRKYVELENKAMAQAKSRYPNNGNRRMSYEDKLIANYKSQLAQEYGVEEAIVDSVSLEGMMEKWNLP